MLGWIIAGVLAVLLAGAVWMLLHVLSGVGGYRM